MNKMIFCAICSVFSSCTCTMNVIQTQGEATDILDANHSLDADANLNAEIPIKLTP